MNSDLIILLALDTLLLEIDEKYEGVPEEQYNLINSKVLESYGLTIHSTKEEIDKMQQTMKDDVRKYRDKLISELK